MFEFVSGANFLGEILEWAGFALAAGGQLPALAFAVFTALNIGPRALQHHKDYQRRFSGESKDKPAYPPHRKALIPFVL
jgi:3-oxo-5-alpha-steroid 4-dehydrogenase 1